MSRLLRAVVFAAASLSILSPNALATSWSKSAIVAPAEGSTIAASTPVVAADGAGKLTAVWGGGGASGNGVYSATRGMTSSDPWSTPVFLGATAATPQQLRLDVNAAGQAVAGWVELLSGGDTRLVSLTRTAGGTWSTPTYLGQTGSALHVAHELVVDPSGLAVGAWADGARADTNGDNTYDAGAITQNSGSAPALTPGPASTISDSGGRHPIDLAIDGAGNATLLYLDESRLIVYSSTRPAGGSWGTPQKVDQWVPGASSTSPEVAQPQIAVNASGAAVATWLRGSEEGARLYVSTRPAGGGDWSAPTYLDGGGFGEAFTDVAVGIDGAARSTALWAKVTFTFDLASETLDLSAVVKSSSASAGGSWEAAQARSKTSSNVYSGLDLDVAENGDTVALWTNLQSSIFASIEGAARRAGEAWEAPGAIASVAPTGSDTSEEGDAGYDNGLALSSVVATASEGVAVFAAGRSIRASSLALIDPPEPGPGPGPAPGPVPQSGPAPAPVITPLPFVPGGTPTPPSGSTTDKKSVPQLKIAMYMVPRGKSCPKSAKTKIGKKTTKLRMRKVRKTIKKKRRTLCKVTGTIKVPSNTEIGKVYKLKVTAKRVKTKKVKIEVTDKNDD